MNARSGPTAALRRVAFTLQTRREEAGQTIGDVARALGVAEMTVRRLEAAESVPRRERVEFLLRRYETSEGEIDQILADLREANTPGWWHAYRDVLPDHLIRVIGLECEAELVRVYAPGTVPPLLQTEPYAEAMEAASHPCESAERIRRRVELLVERQKRAFARPDPLHLWVLIEEAALSRPVGSPEVMRGQYAHLQELATDPTTTIAIQVVKANAGPHAMLTSGPAELIRPTSASGLSDWLVVPTPHAETTTVTNRPAIVRAYQVAMDKASIVGSPPRIPLPTP